MYKRIAVVESDFELLDLERGLDEDRDGDEVQETRASPLQHTMKPPEVEHQERELEMVQGTGDLEPTVHKLECCSTPSLQPQCCSTQSRDVLSLWRLVKSLLLTPVKPESSLL